MQRNFSKPYYNSNTSAARYYNSDLSIWISVDPLVDKYPNLSPYTYCAGNPVRFFDPDGTWIPGLDDDGNVTYTAEKGDSYSTFIRQFDCGGKGKEIFKQSGYGLSDNSIKEGQIIKGETVKKIMGNDVLKGIWSAMTKDQKASQIIFALMVGEKENSEFGEAYAIDLNDYIINFNTYQDGLRLNGVQVPVKGGGRTTVNMNIAPVSTIANEKQQLPVYYGGIASGTNNNTIHYYCAKNPKAKCKMTAITITPSK